jgi:glycosyltransferase involved in cell wall biosynthesis
LILSQDSSRAVEGYVPRVIVFHPAMAPYRSDLFNLLACRCAFRVVFLQRLPPYDANLCSAELAGAMQCDYRVLGQPARPNLRVLVSELLSELRDWRPDVVVTHEFNVASLLVNASPIFPRRIGRVIWTTRNAAQIRGLAGIRRAGVRLLSSRADSLLTYSTAARHALASVAGVSIDKIFVCANHQSGERLRSLAAQGASIVAARVASLGIRDCKAVVTVGRLVPSKNTAATIQEFVVACREAPDTVLLIIGDGPLRGELQRMASTTELGNRIHFLGHVSGAETQAWLSVATLNVLASVEEPYGAVVSEGLALGVPCVCSAGAGASVLIGSGKTPRGTVFDPTASGELAAAIRAWLPSLESVATLEGRPRQDLRQYTVDDDADGFLQATEYAFHNRARESSAIRRRNT